MARKNSKKKQQPTEKPATVVGDKCGVVTHETGAVVATGGEIVKVVEEKPLQGRHGFHVSAGTTSFTTVALGR